MDIVTPDYIQGLISEKKITPMENEPLPVFLRRLGIIPVYDPSTKEMVLNVLYKQGDARATLGAQARYPHTQYVQGKLAYNAKEWTIADLFNKQSNASEEISNSAKKTDIFDIEAIRNQWIESINQRKPISIRYTNAQIAELKTSIAADIFTKGNKQYLNGFLLPNGVKIGITSDLEHARQYFAKDFKAAPDYYIYTWADSSLHRKVNNKLVNTETLDLTPSKEPSKEPTKESIQESDPMPSNQAEPTQSTKKISIKGTFVQEGVSNYKDDPTQKVCPFIELKLANGKLHKEWGVDFPRAIAESGIEVGQKISATLLGKKWVTIPQKDPKTQAIVEKRVQRNTWQINVLDKEETITQTETQDNTDATSESFETANPTANSSVKHNVEEQTQQQTNGIPGCPMDVVTDEEFSKTCGTVLPPGAYPTETTFPENFVNRNKASKTSTPKNNNENTSKTTEQVQEEQRGAGKDDVEQPSASANNTILKEPTINIKYSQLDYVKENMLAALRLPAGSFFPANLVTSITQANTIADLENLANSQLNPTERFISDYLAATPQSKVQISKDVFKASKQEPKTAFIEELLRTYGGNTFDTEVDTQLALESWSLFALAEPINATCVRILLAASSNPELYKNLSSNISNEIGIYTRIGNKNTPTSELMRQLPALSSQTKYAKVIQQAFNQRPDILNLQHIHCAHLPNSPVSNAFTTILSNSLGEPKTTEEVAAYAMAQLNQLYSQGVPTYTESLGPTLIYGSNTNNIATNITQIENTFSGPTAGAIKTVEAAVVNTRNYPQAAKFVDKWSALFEQNITNIETDLISNVKRKQNITIPVEAIKPIINIQTHKVEEIHETGLA